MVLRRVLSLAMAAALSVAAAHADIATFRVGGWNMESGESDDDHLKQQIGEKQNVDLWGFSEVRNADAARAFEEGAEIGEGADFDTILGTTGGADRLAIVFNTTRVELLGWEELDDDLFETHRAPLVARFRGKTTNLEFKFMVNHLARTNNAARLEQAQFLRQWIESEPLPVIAVGDYNFDFHVQFGDAGNRDPGYDAMLEGNDWIWLRPETLVKTQASDGYMSVLDFVFVANPPPGVTGESTIIEREGDTPAIALDFDDSLEDTDHRPVVALFTVGAETDRIEALMAADEALPSADAAILSRIEALEREVEELKAQLRSQ